MELSVIIVNYNVGYFLEQCLCSVKKATIAIEAEIFVVDNHSPDNSLTWLRPRFPTVHFIANTTNLGFSRANNLAIAKSSGKYVLFLNPDTLVPENALVDCIAYMTEHPEAGAAGIRMIDSNGAFLPESKRSYPSLTGAFCKLAGLSRMFPRSAVFNRYALGDKDQHLSQRVSVLAGACMLVKKDILQQAGGFDEDYFMYGEDIDLSYRIEELGFENHYFAGASILHFKGASIHKDSFLYTRNFYGAMLVFIKKHYRTSLLRYCIPAAVLIRGMVSFSGNRLRKLFSSPRKISPDPVTTLVVGSHADYLAVLPFLQGIAPRRVATGEFIEDTICALPDLAIFCRWNGIREVIFCEGQLSLQMILAYVEQLNGSGLQFLFHMAGSGSVVGRGYTVTIDR